MLVVLGVAGKYSYDYYQSKKIIEEIRVFDKQVTYVFKDLWELNVQVRNEPDAFSRVVKQVSTGLEDLKANLPEPSYHQTKIVQEQYFAISQSGLAQLEEINSQIGGIVKVTQTVPGLYAEKEKYAQVKADIDEYFEWSSQGYDRLLDVRDTFKSQIESSGLSSGFTSGLLAYNNMVHYGLARKIKAESKFNPIVKSSQNLITWSFENRNTFRITENRKMDFKSYDARGEFQQMISDIDTQLKVLLRHL